MLPGHPTVQGAHPAAQGQPVIIDKPMISLQLSSLRSRLILTLLIACIPAGWLFLHASQEIRTIVATEIGERETLQVARAAIRDHQRLIAEAQQLLSTLSLLPEVRSGACDRLLAQLAGLNKNYLNLGVLSPEGDVQCSAMPADKPLNLAQRSYFQRAIASRAFSIGDYQIGQITKQPSLVVAQPVFGDQQQLLAVIYAALDLKQFGKLIESSQLPQNSVLEIFGLDGTIFLRYPQPEQFIGKQQPHIERIRDELLRKPEMVIETTGLDGIKRLAAVTLLDNSSKTSAYLQIAIPSAALHEKLSALFNGLVIQLSLALLLIVVALGMGIERFVIGGITKLSSAVRSFAQGSHRPQMSLRGESAEIVQLIRTFDDMAATLQKRRHELEQQQFALDQHAIVSIADSSGNIIYTNQKFCDITQYPPEALIGLNHRILNSGYHPPEFFQEMWETISAGKVWQGEFRNRKRDGSYYWVETTIVPLIDHSGKPYQYVSIRTDITALMLIQEELRQARDRLEARVQERTADLIQANRTLAHDIATRKQVEQVLQTTLESERRTAQQQIAILDALPARIALLTNDGGIAAVNQAWCEFAATNELADRRSWLGDNYLEVCDRAQGEGSQEAHATAEGIRTVLNGQQSLFSMEYASPSPQEQRWHQLLAAPIVSGAAGSQRGAVVMHIDISERVRSERNMQRSYNELNQMHKSLKAAQTQLLQSEKMASVGQLAAGLAHEINNPIGYVHSNLETLHEDLAALFEMLAAYKEIENLLPADRLETLHRLRQRIDLDFLERDLSKLILQCRDGTTRVKAIVKSLLEFSHADQGKWELTDLHQELESAITLASHGIKRKAEVVKAFGDIPKIECRPLQLSQVFINLLMNAAHAIDKHGTITVRTGTQDSGVWIEIADTGSGISSEDMPRIFDPFFTTKPVGSGTGLGLSLSYRIVQEHQGRLTVDSEAGKGATFRIWLPLRQSPGA